MSGPVGVEDMTRYFAFLDALRSSGVTNMWGAGAYLDEAFGLGRGLSRSVLADWMESFSDEQSAAERAAAVVVAKV